MNRRNVRYLVVGGHAVAAHGYPRATQDIDLVVALDEKNALEAVEALLELGYRPLIPIDAREFADAQKRLAWQTEKGAVVFQMTTGDPLDMPVDLFVSAPFDFEREFSSALIIEWAEGVTVPVVARTTLMEMKRLAGRGKDLIDLEQLEAKG